MTGYNSFSIAHMILPDIKRFSATVWPNGHYVHTISGFREQPVGYHYWLLYRLPTEPDPASPPPTTFVAPAGKRPTTYIIVHPLLHINGLSCSVCLACSSVRKYPQELSDILRALLKEMH